MQYVDLYLPTPPLSLSSPDDDGRTPVRGAVFFVHGGAWGSGMPWMYRLVAPTFLRLDLAVIVVGYRTYPDASTINEQVRDVVTAWEVCGDALDVCCRATGPATTTTTRGRRKDVGNVGNDDDVDA